MKPAVRKTIGVAVAGVILFFIIRNLVSGLADMETIRFTVRPWRIAGSFLMLAVLFPAYGRLWQYILARLGYAIAYRESMRIWFLSQAGRYVPGKIWFALGRIYLCERAGIPRSTATVAMGLELALVLASAIIAFGIAAMTSPVLARREYLLGLVLVPVVIAAVHPAVIRWVLKKFKRLPADFDLSYPDILKVLVLYVICWGIYGIGFHLIGTAFWVSGAPPGFYSTGAAVLPEMIGVNAIAWAGGLLSVVTPAGLGVREGISGVLLSGLVEKPYPSLIPLVARLWVTVAELGTIGILLLARDRK
ncbi:MAG: hypothetical protein PVH52_04945 [bacterium]|jgi:uncharacterized membrane protein YbhN (UPF0104 family)